MLGAPTGRRLTVNTNSIPSLDASNAVPEPPATECNEGSWTPTPALIRAVEELRPMWASLDHAGRVRAIGRLWDICDRDGLDPEVALDLLDSF
jgi:hypothetical protein